MRIIDLLSRAPAAKPVNGHAWLAGGGSPAAATPGEDRDADEVGWAPAADVRETATAFIIKIDVPGVDPAQILVAFERDALVISGARAGEPKDEGKGFHRYERFEGPFLRRFVLPETADPYHVEAHSADGVLTVTIPKVDPEHGRRVQVVVKAPS